MKIGDKVYIISENAVGIVEKQSVLHGFMLKSNNGTDYYNYSEILSIEQCADIITNVELQQLVLNYKK